MAKVFHVTVVHPITDPRIFLKECTTLATHGHNVTALACFEGGASESGLFSMVSVGKPSRKRWRRLGCQWRVLQKLLKARPDIVHFHDPELLPVMLALASIMKPACRFIFDVHENHESMIQAGHRLSLARWLYRRLFALAETRITIILAEDSYHVFCRHPHPVIHNYALNHQPLPWELRRKQIVYMGALSEERGALNMIRGFAAAELVDWELVIIGGCDARELQLKMKQEADQLGLGKRFKMTGHLPHQEAMRVVRQSRIGLALLHPLVNYLHSLPTKVFDYLSVEIPAVLSDFPFYQEFFGGLGAIAFANPLDPVSIGAAIRKLVMAPDLRGMGAECRQRVVERFSWNLEGRRLLEIYEALSSKR